MNETELLQKIKNAEQQLAEARRMLEDYRNKSPWKPRDGETYWYISSAGDVLPEVWQGYDTDKGRYATGGIFRTEDDAEREVRRRKTHQKLKELAAKWNTEPIRVDNNQAKYGLYLLTSGKLAMYSTDYAIKPNTVYFNKYALDDILEEIPEEELIEYCKGDY